MSSTHKVLITKFPRESFLSGVEKHTFKVVEGLQTKGVEFTLASSDQLTLKQFNKKEVKTSECWAGLEPTTRSSQLLFFISWPLILFSLLILLFRFKAKGYSVLYCLTLTEKILLTPWAKLLGFKVLWLEIFDPEKQLKANPYTFLYKLWSSQAKIIVISNFIRNQLVELGVKEEKITVIYDGIDPDLYKKQQDLFDAMAEKKHKPIERFRYNIGFVGRLHQDKGIHLLLRAVSLLKKDLPALAVTIVGEGPDRHRLEWLIKEYELRNEVKLVGYKEDDLLKWIWNFDVFVLPSVNEAFGITVIEAMACAKPVIVSTVGGLPEIVENEQNGLLVQPNNSQALALAIEKLYKDKELATRLGKEGEQMVNEKFVLQKMVQSFHSLVTA